jgi:hypothetical protein
LTGGLAVKFENGGSPASVVAVAHMNMMVGIQFLMFLLEHDYLVLVVAGCAELW